VNDHCSCGCGGMGGHCASGGAQPVASRPVPFGFGVVDQAGFRSPSDTANSRFTGGLSYYAEVGDTFHPMEGANSPTEGLPYQQSIGPTSAQAGPQGFDPKMTAFTNRALYKRVNPGKTTIAVPQSSLGPVVSKPHTPKIRPMLGYVTRWPQPQLEFGEIGAGQ
jgi:hypothetical protein